MSQETTDNFWAAWAQPLPEPAPIFYRLYYNDDGSLRYYSMEDLPGNYIEIDQETYSRSLLNVRVIDGQLIEIKPASVFSKLIPGEHGTPCDPRDITVVVNETAKHIKWKLVSSEIK